MEIKTGLILFLFLEIESDWALSQPETEIKTRKKSVLTLFKMDVQIYCLYPNSVC